MYESVNTEQLGHEMAPNFLIFCNICNESTQQSFDQRKHNPSTMDNMLYQAYCTFQRLPWSIAGYAT